MQGVSPETHVEVLTPNPPEWACIWRQGLSRGNQVKMRPLGWALIQHDWCPYKKRRSGHRHARREDDVRTQGEDGRRHAKKKVFGRNQPPEL